jgi:hypothetical protein
VRPQADDYPQHIERAIRALVEHGVDAGRSALEPIAYPAREINRRPSLPRPLVGKIFQRDQFHCRYCDGRVIPTPIMEILGGVYPELFPFHPNWRGGATHPAVISRSPLVDHVLPGSIGGDWLATDNLATACNPCNSIKADFTLAQLGWELRPIVDDGWDGLASFYLPLWERAGRPNPPFHRSWMSALGYP